MSDEQYNSTLSRNRFLFPETKIVAKLKPEGLNDSTIVKTLSYKDSNSFFQQLKEKQDELISWVAAIGPVRGFFQNQVDKFDEGRKKLEYYQNNLMYIAVDDVKSNVEKLQQILEDPAPYGSIKDIPYLLHSLDDVFKQELEARKKSDLERINKASALITEEI